MLKRRDKQIGVGGTVITPLHRRYVNQVLDSGRLTYGPFLKSFERRFADLHNRRFGIAVNSGTSALQVALQALRDVHGWKPGDEVIVPALTFVSTVNVVLQNGLRPVFADIDPRTYHLDPAEVEKKITPRTRAIMPVHLFGASADMRAIMAIARKNRLRVLEDSAQTMFVNYRGEPVGSQGDIACYSTYVSHIITTGVGGLALANSPVLARYMQSLVNYGRHTAYRAADDDRGLSGRALLEMMRHRFHFVTAGYSYRLTELEGALGLAELERVAGNLKHRQANADYLLKGLRPYTSYLQLPWWPPHAEHAFMMFPVTVKTKKFSRDDITHWLEEWNVETRPLYPLLGEPAYRKIFGNIASRFPVASFTQKNGFFIGCHTELTKSDLDYVLAVFKEFFSRKKFN